MTALVRGVALGVTPCGPDPDTAGCAEARADGFAPTCNALPSEHDGNTCPEEDDVSEPVIGSLFSGYGGLDMAARAVFGGTVAWTSDNHPSAVKTLAHHNPGVPNYGDITRIGLDYSDAEWAAMQRRAVEDPDYVMPMPDWTAVEPVDLLCAGFPCQDISPAGKRAGIEGARSGLWSYVADAVRVLRPRHVVLENVSALLVRGLDRVAADLAEIGYDLRWTCLRASDVGAPHLRNRWFGLAEDPNVAARGERRLATPGQAQSGGPRADLGGRGRASAADAGRDARAEDHEDEPAATRRGGTASDTNRGGQPGFAERHGEPVGAWQGEHRLDADRCVLDWAQFEPAIRRWEHVLGRPAPAPTVDGRRGNRVLSPLFVEWLMGLPAGHVTAVPDLSRNDQLRLLGNGVVPQQGAAALRWLLTSTAKEGAA